MEFEFKKGAFSYFFACRIREQLYHLPKVECKWLGWTEEGHRFRRWDGWVSQEAQCIASGHVTKQNLPSVWHMRFDCWHEFLGFWFKKSTLCNQKGQTKDWPKTHHQKADVDLRVFRIMLRPLVIWRRTRLELSGVSVCGCRLIKTRPSGLRYWQ